MEEGKFFRMATACYFSTASHYMDDGQIERFFPFSPETFNRNHRAAAGNPVPATRKPVINYGRLSVKIIIPLMIALFLATGCGLQTVRTAPRLDGQQPTVVNVFVIRNTSDFDPPRTPSYPWPVTIDDFALCQLNPGEYTLLHAVEGETHWVGIQYLQLWWHKEKDYFIAEPDGNYYFLTGVRDNSLFIERINQESARAYLGHYKQVCVEPRPVKAQKPMPVPKPVPKMVAPAPPVPKEVAKIAPPKVDEIFFDLNSAKITPQMDSFLDAIVRYLQEEPSTTVVLGGHACDLGTDKYNLDLSRRRAEAVRSYLLDKNISENRIGVKIFGESNPKYDNSKEKTRKLNRRVDFQFKTN